MEVHDVSSTVIYKIFNKKIKFNYFLFTFLPTSPPPLSLLYFQYSPVFICYIINPNKLLAFKPNSSSCQHWRQIYKLFANI